MAVLRQGPALRWGLVLVTTALVATSLVFYALDDLRDPVDLVVDLSSMFVPVGYGTVGAILTGRRSSNVVGWLCGWIGFVWGVQSIGDAIGFWSAHRGHLDLASWVGALTSMWLVAVGLTVHLALRLPNGHLLTPGWRLGSWACTAIVLVVGLVQFTVPGPVDAIPGTHNPLAAPGLQVLSPLFLLLIVALLLSVFSLALRYRGAGTVERLQLRWIALSVLFLLVVGGSVAVTVGSTGTFSPWLAVVDSLANVGLPVSIGIAVLRYRLYEIDVIINRALVYGSLTATLALTYVGLVLLLQVLVDPISNDSALVTAVSTLAVAALFRPARARIQQVVDRRFYRSRYDARGTLERFGARLRDEVDLQALSRDLRAAATETMQPAHVSLWLREKP